MTCQVYKFYTSLQLFLSFCARRESSHYLNCQGAGSNCRHKAFQASALPLSYPGTWAGAGSNCRPHPYQRCALTDWATRPISGTWDLNPRPLVPKTSALAIWASPRTKQYRGRDLNPHALRHLVLSQACLPIPPPRL